MKKSLLLLPLLIVLTGCGSGEQQGLISWMKKEENKVKPKIAPVPTLKSEEVINFENAKVEPFGANSAEDIYLSDRKKEILELYPLDTLKMVGSYLKNKKRYALIKASDGVVYIVSIGSKIGENYGIITSISEDKIIGQEKIKAGEGKFTDEMFEKSLEPDVIKKKKIKVN